MGNESSHVGKNEMAGLRVKRPPGNMNAFSTGGGYSERREEGVPTEHEETVRQQILDD